HPQGQSSGYSFGPPVPAREAAVAREHGCAICAEIARESASGERVVTTHGDWVAWVPYASGYAYGLRIAPRTHNGSLTDLDDASRDALAATLVDALARYDPLWPAPAHAPRCPSPLHPHHTPHSARTPSPPTP